MKRSHFTMYKVIQEHWQHPTGQQWGRVFSVASTPINAWSETATPRLSMEIAHFISIYSKHTPRCLHKWNKHTKTQDTDKPAERSLSEPCWAWLSELHGACLQSCWPVHFLRLPRAFPPPATPGSETTYWSFKYSSLFLSTLVKPLYTLP